MTRAVTGRAASAAALATLILIAGCVGAPGPTPGDLGNVATATPVLAAPPSTRELETPSWPAESPTHHPQSTATVLATPTAMPPASTASAPAVATAPATPAGASGGPPQPVLEVGHSEPSLVVDAAGHAHIAAVHEGGISYANSVDGTWTSVGISSATGGDPNAPTDRQPTLAMDVDGRLALAFSRWGAEDTFGRLPEGVLIARAEAGAGAWSEPVALIDDPNGGHSPSLALDGDATHVAYALGIGVDVVTEEMSFPVHYLSDVDGAVSDVEVSPNGTAPVLAVDAGGIVHILFGDENGLLETDALWHAAATSGAGFDAQPIPGTTRYASPHDLSVDPLGNVHIAWTRPGFTTAEDRYSALHQHWSGSWSDPETIALDATVRAIAADAHGHVHLVGSDLDGAWYATDRSGSFELTRLASEPEVGADVAVDAFGRAHVVFAIGEGQESQLWYWIGDAP